MKHPFTNRSQTVCATHGILLGSNLHEELFLGARFEPPQLALPLFIHGRRDAHWSTRRHSANWRHDVNLTSQGLTGVATSGDRLDVKGLTRVMSF